MTAQSRQQVLDENPSLSPSQLAHVVGRVHTRGARKGEPNVRAIRDEIRDGRWPLVDPSAPAHHWQVPSVFVRRLLAGEVA